MSAFEIYLILKLDVILNVFTSITVAVGLYVLCMSIAYSSEYSDDYPGSFFQRNLKKILVSFFILMFISAAIPSPDTATKMIVYPKLLTKESIAELQKLPPEILSIATKSLDKIKKELEKGE